MGAPPALDQILAAIHIESIRHTLLGEGEVIGAVVNKPPRDWDWVWPPPAIGDQSAASEKTDPGLRFSPSDNRHGQNSFQKTVRRPQEGIACWEPPANCLVRAG